MNLKTENEPFLCGNDKIHNSVVAETMRRRDRLCAFPKTSFMIYADECREKLGVVGGTIPYSLEIQRRIESDWKNLGYDGQQPYRIKAAACEKQFKERQSKLMADAIEVIDIP